MIGVNPFAASLVVALVVVATIVMRSRRRTGPEPRATKGPGVPTGGALVLALAAVLVPFSIAVAAVWGPSVGMAAYVALLAGGSIALASRRFRH